jgi:hypothetical protein
MSNKVRKMTGMSVRAQAGAAVTAVGLCAAVAVPASAQANPSPAKSPNHLRASRHCVVHLAEQGRATCYDSFRKAIADASGGQITDAPDSAAGVDPRLDARINALPGAKKRGASALGGIVLSIEYVDINFGSSTFTFTGNRECTAPTSDLDYQYPDLAVRGWDPNRIPRDPELHRGCDERPGVVPAMVVTALRMCRTASSGTPA